MSKFSGDQDDADLIMKSMVGSVSWIITTFLMLPSVGFLLVIS